MQSRFRWTPEIQSYSSHNVNDNLIIEQLKNEVFNNLFLTKSDITETFVAPCGACRQFIAEFGPNIEIVMVKNKDEVKRNKIHEILPFIFDQSSLALNPKDSNGV